MTETSTYPLRLPKSLKEQVVKLAKRDGTSINQFIAMVVAEKISAMATGQFYVDRLKQSDRKAFRAILFLPGGELPQNGDEL